MKTPVLLLALTLVTSLQVFAQYTYGPSLPMPSTYNCNGCGYLPYPSTGVYNALYPPQPPSTYIANPNVLSDLKNGLDEIIYNVVEPGYQAHLPTKGARSMVTDRFEDVVNTVYAPYDQGTLIIDAGMAVYGVYRQTNPQVFSDSRWQGFNRTQPANDNQGTYQPHNTPNSNFYTDNPRITSNPYSAWGVDNTSTPYSSSSTGSNYSSPSPSISSNPYSAWGTSKK